MHGRFVRNDDEKIVYDYARGLAWTDTPTYGSGAYFQATRGCNNLVYGGYDDWMLPSLANLQSIIDPSRPNPPYIYSVFKGIDAKGFWADNWNYNLGTSTVVSFITGRTLEVNIYSSMNYVCTRFFDRYSTPSQTAMLNEDTQESSRVIRE